MIYLDNNATTPVDPRVIEVLTQCLRYTYGNSSSRDHTFGWDAAEAVEEARGHVAHLINARPMDVVFTSGATEGTTCAIRTLGEMAGTRHALAGATEHESVLENVRALQCRSGLRLRYLAVDRVGRVALDAVANELQRGDPAFVCLMLANNELGNVHPIQELALMVHHAGGTLFCDITQAVGKVAVDVQRLGVDLAVFSAHKMYGPKGVGALYVRPGGQRLSPLILGGGQERGLRAGTVNVPGIVGFGEACRIASVECARDAERTRALRDRLENGLLSALPDIWINGDRDNRLPNTTNIRFRGVDARALIRDMRNVAVATKSACSSGKSGASHVLKAIGLTDEEAYSSIRFSLGRFTTDDEIQQAVASVVSSVRKLRGHLATSVEGFQNTAER